MEELLTLKELAKKLKISYRQVVYLKKKGLPSIMVGKDERYYLSEVVEHQRKREENHEES